LCRGCQRQLDVFDRQHRRRDTVPAPGPAFVEPLEHPLENALALFLLLDERLDSVRLNIFDIGIEGLVALERVARMPGGPVFQPLLARLILSWQSQQNSIPRFFTAQVMKAQPTCILPSLLHPAQRLSDSLWYMGQSRQDRPQTPISGCSIFRESLFGNARSFRDRDSKDIRPPSSHQLTTLNDALPLRHPGYQPRATRRKHPVEYLSGKAEPMTAAI
jgi:hypothetical protein